METGRYRAGAAGLHAGEWVPGKPARALGTVSNHRWEGGWHLRGHRVRRADEHRWFVIRLWGTACWRMPDCAVPGPSIQSEAQAHLHVNWPWWVWALAIWAVVAGLGLARVEIVGRVLAVLTAAEIIIAETVSGLASPADGHLDVTVTNAAMPGTISCLSLPRHFEQPRKARRSRSQRPTVRGQDPMGTSRAAATPCAHRACLLPAPRT
jgi:amino acid transporter